MWGRVARVGTVLALATLACGGKSAAPTTNADGTPTTVSGSGNGGSGSGSGNSNSNSNSGNSNGGSGAASGNANERCAAPPDSGNCLEDTVAWYHELATGICRPFTYGGCGGNANRYPSLAACQAACALTAPAYDACARNSDCVIAPSMCCLECGSINVGAQHLIAYNQRYSELVESGARCVPTRNNLRYFVGECVQNRCRVTDLLNSSATQCSADEDCVFHRGLECCESCDLNDVIAISKYGDFSALTCKGDEECAPCEPPPVEHTSLFCNDGYCRAAPWRTQ